MRTATLTSGLLAAALGIAAFDAAALAETRHWPQHTVRLIVPFGAGTSNDTTARYFADGLARRWGQGVVIENQPGADTMKGVGIFASTRDDHTLLFTGAASLT